MEVKITIDAGWDGELVLVRSGGLYTGLPRLASELSASNMADDNAEQRPRTYVIPLSKSDARPSFWYPTRRTMAILVSCWIGGYYLLPCVRSAGRSVPYAMITRHRSLLP